MVDRIYPIINKQVHLPVYLTGIGHQEPEYHIFRSEGLVSHQILITLSGCGILKVGGEEFRLKENSVFYLASGTPHEYYPEDGKWETIWVVFRGKEIGTLMKDLGFGDYAVCENCDCKELIKLYHKIFNSALDPLAFEDCSALTYQLIVKAKSVFYGFRKGALANPLARSLKYIDENFASDISLEDLSSIAGITKQHFCRLFKATFDMRPTEYIKQKRLNHAKDLLRHSEKSISEIGALSGYPDPTYFGIVFKSSEGISPGEYRKLRIDI